MFISIKTRKMTNENILSAVAQMPQSEFARFLSEVGRRRGKLLKVKPNEEIRLIKKVNEAALSQAEQGRFSELVEKRREEKINARELSELMALTEKSEELNGKRLKYLVKLAHIRRQTLREVMLELEILPPQTI